VPDAPDDTVTKLPLLVAVHVHVDPAVTAAELVPPSGPNVVVGWLTLYEHVGLVGGVDVLLSLPHATAIKAAASDTPATRDQRKRSVIGTSIDVL
jgi:hypothetical protein